MSRLIAETAQEQKRARLRAWRANNPDRVREHNRRRAAKHAEAIRAYKRRWRDERLDDVRKQARARYAANPAAAKRRAREWNRSHPGVINALTARRRAAIEQRMPPWLTSGHLGAIRAIYQEATARSAAEGVRYHVDHVVPLQGRGVSGLHVPWNLRVVPASVNCAKGNKWPIQS